MKHLKLFFALFAMLALGVTNAWGETVTYQHVFNKKPSTGNSVALSSVNWKIEATALNNYNSNNYAGVQIGSSKAAGSITLTSTTDWDYNGNGKITEVRLWLNTGGSTVTPTVTIGGKSATSDGTKVVKNSTAGTDWTKATKVTFTPVADGNTGVVVIKVSTVNAGYICAMEIDCEPASSGGDEGGSEETTYSVTVNQPANGTISATGLTDGKAAEGTIVKLTATPTTEGYKFGAWTVTGASGNVAVTDNQFTMPAEDVTVTASFVAKTQYTIKWNVAEGSVADTKVYEGETLGSFPTAPNCSAGKVFVGWTAATSVSSDGSGITYVKATDIPNGNKEYNAVYATEITTGGGGAAKYVKATTISDGTYLIAATNGANSYAYTGQVTGKTYGGYTSVTISDNEIATKPDAALEVTVKVTDGKFSMHDGTSYLYLSSNDNNLNFTTTEKTDWILDDGKIKNTAITASTRYLQFNSASGSERFACYKSTQKDAYLYKKGDGSSISYVDYSLDCAAHQDPFLTVTETAINFGTVAQNATVTETLKVSGGYLAEDVTLTISGTNASIFSVSPETITKAEEVDQDVTITYNPTATGDHTATLTIKTGDITKTVDLSGTVLAPGKWALVKNVAELSAGDEIIIAAASADYAIGEAASNNYKGAAITKVGETANADASVTVLTIEETGVAEAPYALKDGSKYLYAAGPSNNYLKAQATNNVNGQWAVTITDGVASIVAAKSSNRNVMQFNPNNGSPIFACYASATQQALAIYRNSENVAKPVISGEVNFVGSTQVTITAQSGLTVYYTTDGTDPDNTSTQYTAPFTINATTTVKAIAYDASSNASGVAEMTFTKHELVNVATAMALAKDKIAYFAEFEVVKVVTGKGNIYIKDASGYGLIYDNTLAGELKDGDRVQGFVGVSSPYNDLPEAKPVDGLTVADLTITSGVAAEPYDFTSTAIAATDINKYVVFNDVEIATAVSMSNSNKGFSLTINGSNVAFYNQFSIEKTLEAGKTYDIYGFVSIYNEKLQVYFYQALEEDEVVTKYTVTYNAGGATGEVPVDDNEYTKGAQVYLKSATGLTKEGYDYKGWKVTDEGGNEIAVSSNKFNMPASNVTVTAQWEEIVVTPRQDFSAGYWVLVSSASELAAGDKIVVAAVEEDYAMKSYESGNNIKHLAITKLGDKRFLKWTSEVGVFQLASSGSGYTIQDVNTEEYLYAAGSGDNNYLKAADEVPSDAAAAKPYIWTISYTDGVATVKATSDNHNDLQYNKSADLFSCYASTQGEIALYKHVDNIDPTLVTPSVEKGIFSVADDKFVQFSTGNLQYEVGTNTWSFAENQYDYVGEANINVGDPTFTGTIDMFGWSTNDADNNYGVNPNNVNELYDGTFQDWSALVDEADWYTLSADEWKYLLNKRTNASSLKQIAKVNNGEKDIVGIMLFPDAWTMPADVNVAAAYDDYFKVNIYNYTLEQWTKLEEAGAVFLPAAGRRTGGYGNMINYDQQVETNPENLNGGHYKHQDNTNIYCYYWTSTINESTKDVSYLHNIQALGGDKYTIGIGAVWGEKGRYGQSVRLVKAIEPDHTRTVTSGDYGTICLPNGGLLLGASAFSVLKMEGTTILLYEVGTTMVAGTPYVVFPNTGAKNLYVFYTDNANAPAGNANGLYGSYTREPLAPNAGYYIMLPGNRYAEVTGDRVFVAANRAYFKVDDIEDISTTAPALAPGVRRIAIGQAPQVATGMENIDASAQPVKTIINGQLYILRGEKMYDAQGKLVK